MFPNNFQLFYSIMGVLMFLAYGYNDVISITCEDMIKEGLKLSAFEAQMMVYAIHVHSIIGAVAGGVLSDFFGRRLTLVAGGGLHSVGILATCFARSYGVVMVGRFFMGLGTGFGLTAGAVYVAELSPPRARGYVIALPEILVEIGSILGYISYNHLSDKLFSDMAWRLMVAAGAIPSVILVLVALIVIPESPSWLIRCGKLVDTEHVVYRCTTDRGEANLRLVHMRSATSIPVGTVEPIVAVPEHVRPGHFVLPELLLPRHDMQVNPILIRIMILHILQQVSGVKFVITDSSTLFGYSKDLTISQEMLLTEVIILTQVIFMCFISLLFNKIGRRQPYLSSIGAVAASQVIFGVLQLAIFQNKLDGAVIFGLGFASLLALVVSFSCGVGPIPWVYSCESLPFRLRAQGSSLGVAANLMVKIVSDMTFTTLFNSITIGGIFLVYGLLTIIGFAFSCHLIEETRGLILEQETELLNNPDGEIELGGQDISEP